MPRKSGVHERKMRARSGQQEERLDSSPNPATLVAHASRVIAERLSGKIQIQMLADELGIDKFCFIRTFRRHTGKTPYEYVLQLRIEEARRQLALNRPVCAVAFECGFADQSHLTRLFRRRFGVTPRAYQERLRTSTPAPATGASAEERAA